MNIVYLSPNFPPNFVPFVEALGRTSANVLCVGDEPWEQLDERVRQAATEYFKVSSLESYDEVLRALGFFTHKYGKIDRVESHNEHWLNLEGSLREDFNIPGKKREETKVIRHKSLMKKVFADAGLKVAEGELFESLAQGKAFAKKVGFPIIAKPDDGVGASRTHRVENQDGLKRVWDEREDTTYFLEEYIEGELFSFDGLTNADGEVVFHQAMTFSDGIMNTVNMDQDLSYQTLLTIPRYLEKDGFRSIEAFDIREKFFHLEFIKPKSKRKYIAMEINVRPPGGLSVDMFNYQCDFNIFQRWAEMVVDGVWDANWERKFAVAFIGRKHSLTYANSKDDIYGRFGDLVVSHEHIASVFRNAIGDEGYVARAVDNDTLKDVIAFTQEKKA